MPASAELVVVPPLEAPKIWPRVAHLIEAAMRRGDFGAYGPVAAAVLTGRALLWIAWEPGPDGAREWAAAVTEITQTEWRRVCTIVACGGADRARWINLIHPIEDYARAAECSAMRIIGRKGWQRVLPDYRPVKVVLERKL
jgi:hypothetical protein